jgi:hypothetical protein
MEWADRLGALYSFLGVPAMAKDMALNGPQGDMVYDLAYAMQTTSAPIDVYPADAQTFGG